MCDDFLHLCEFLCKSLLISLFLVASHFSLDPLSNMGPVYHLVFTAPHAIFTLELHLFIYYFHRLRLMRLRGNSVKLEVFQVVKGP